MQLFDCCASFGTSVIPPLKPANEPADLIAEMDRWNISEALVFHATMQDDSPVVGNKLLVRATANYGRLNGTWAILPPQTDELGTPEEFIAQMKKYKIYALWAFPSEHRYLLTATTFGPLFELMIQKKIPLLLSVNENSGGLSGWMLVEYILRECPKLTLIITEHGCWGDDRYFRPLLEKYENLYIDTSQYQLDGGIANLCRKYGPHRLLFGTSFPKYYMGGPALTLLHADISEEEKRAIAGGNLRHLLRKVRL